VKAARKPRRVVGEDGVAGGELEIDDDDDMVGESGLLEDCDVDVREEGADALLVVVVRAGLEGGSVADGRSIE